MGIKKNKDGISLQGECPTTDDCSQETCDWIGNYRECPIYRFGGIKNYRRRK